MTRRDDDADQLAAAEGELRRKLDSAGAQYESRLRTYNAVWFGPRSARNDIFYVPLGPERAAEERERAKAEAMAEYDRVLERLLRRAELERTRRARKDDPDDDDDVQVKPDVGLGGRPRKRHPGLALKEAARMLSNGETNKTAIARSATKKARERIEAEKLTEKKWESGFSERDDVDALREAFDGELVMWTPHALLARKTQGEVFRAVDDFEWLEIPQPA